MVLWSITCPVYFYWRSVSIASQFYGVLLVGERVLCHSKSTAIFPRLSLERYRSHVQRTTLTSLVFTVRADIISMAFAMSHLGIAILKTFLKADFDYFAFCITFITVSLSRQKYRSEVTAAQSVCYIALYKSWQTIPLVACQLILHLCYKNDICSIVALQWFYV